LQPANYVLKMSLNTQYGHKRNSEDILSGY
jgi:hypothetical protein